MFFRKKIWLGFIICFVFVGLRAGTNLATTAEAEAAGAPPMCRYGASPTGADQFDWLPVIGAGWYLNFSPGPYEPPPPAGIEFVHVLRVKQDKTAQGDYLPTYKILPGLGSPNLNNHIDNNPGAIWLVGNEVDRGPNPGETESPQDDTHPWVYARAYHEVYHYIKGRDPSARIANSALVQASPNRLQYLDIMWQAYLDRYNTPMPVDIWNMHLYVLPEVDESGDPNGIANVALGTNPSLGKRESGGLASNCRLDQVYCLAEHDNELVYAEQVVAMRQWMKDHGQQQKPLIISEYSILYHYEPKGGGNCFVQDEYGNCFTPNRVANFMETTFDYLRTAKDPSLGYALDENRLVQQWLWFSVTAPRAGKSSDLVNLENGHLTHVGARFSDYVNGRPVQRNLIVEEAAAVLVSTDGQATATAEIGIKFRNNGNVKVTSPYDVRFFGGGADIGTVTVNSIIEGCAVETDEVTMSWSGLPPGKHNYWVVLDDGNDLPETREGDNVAQGVVIVDPVQVFLPLASR